jgi:uracil phosphoribosyltransferase
LLLLNESTSPFLLERISAQSAAPVELWHSSWQNGRGDRALAVALRVLWPDQEAAYVSTRHAYPNLQASEHPLVRHKIRLLADKRTDPKLFRELTKELTSLLVYEATRDLPTREVTFETPLEETVGLEVSSRVGLVPILRAGLGMTDAALVILPWADVWHLGLRRDEETHKPESYYNRLPDICPDDLVIVLDPMLATGGSATAAISTLKAWGAPQVIFVGLIAAPEGVERLLQDHPDVPVHVALLDRQLDDNAYIRPGLGDAGDRMFGTEPSNWR